jgi:hypothetical protein
MRIWQDKNKFFAVFDSISEMVRHCKNAPNGANFGNTRTSQRVDRAWTGTETYEEAEQLITEGWEEGFKKLSDNLKDRDVDEEIQNKRFMPRTDVEGYAPCVPHVIIGRPDTMFNAEMHPKKFKIVDIILNIGVSGGTNTDEIVERGIVAMNYISQLEMAGYRCNLHIARCGVDGGEQVFFLTKIKDSTEPFSIKRMAFPLIHPSMNRRFMFRVLESMNVGYQWTSGYGRTEDDHADELFKIYKKAFIFPSLNTISMRNNPVDYMKKVKEWNKKYASNSK